MNFDEIRPCWLEINLDNLKHNIHTIGKCKTGQRNYGGYKGECL